MRNVVSTICVFLLFALMIVLFTLHRPDSLIDLSHFEKGHYLALENHKHHCEAFIKMPTKQQDAILITGPYPSSGDSLKAYGQLQNCAKTIHMIAKR